MTSEWNIKKLWRRDPLTYVIRYIAVAAFTERKKIARETERYKYKYTASWTNVDAQYNYFKNSGLTQEPLVLNANNHLTEGAGTIQTADLIYFCDQGGLDPNHAGIVYDIDSSGQILYSGHTKSRLDRKLSLYFEACPDANVIVLRWID